MPTFVHTCIAAGLFSASLLNALLWLPSFFTRSYGLSTTEVGFWLALLVGSGQIVGLLVSGYASDYFGRRDLRWYAWIPAIAILAATPLFLITFITTNVTIACASLFIPFALTMMQTPPTFAIVQGIAPPEMRAVAAAILFLSANLIGGGLGPQVVGIVSDLLQPSMGDESLGAALLAVMLVSGVWASTQYLFVARHLRREMRVGATDR